MRRKRRLHIIIRDIIVRRIRTILLLRLIRLTDEKKHKSENHTETAEQNKNKNKTLIHIRRIRKIRRTANTNK